MSGRYLLRTLADYVSLAVVLAALIAAFGYTTEYFFTWTTFLTIANQIPMLLSWLRV